MIIFDCDGVLVDSEIHSIGLLKDHAAKSGIQLTDEEAYSAFLGRPIAAAAQSVCELFGYNIEEIDADEFHVELHAQLKTNLQPISGIQVVLECLEGPKCVASSSNLERIKFSLELTELAQYFSDSMFSTDMVARGKPHPDIFLFAADQFNIEPSDCIVIEDSPAGVRAAKAAGMSVIGFSGGSHAAKANLTQELQQLSPDAIIDQMEMLPPVMESLGFHQLRV